jgi:hypothetical protein
MSRIGKRVCRGWAKLPNPWSEKKARIGGLTIELNFKRDLNATGPDEDDERGNGLLTMKHDHKSHHRNENAPAAVEVDIKNAYGGSDYASLEACFCGHPGVTGAHHDRPREAWG